MSLVHQRDTVGTEDLGQAVGVGTDRERMDVGAQRSGCGEGFQRRGGDDPPVVFDHDEHAHVRIPSSSRTSTTAEAASGPWPRMTVLLACSAAFSSVTMC